MDKTAADGGAVNWALFQECVEAYPPGVDDHHCSQVLANVVARYAIRTRIEQGPDAIPAWAVEYLVEIIINDTVVRDYFHHSEIWREQPVKPEDCHSPAVKSHARPYEDTEWAWEGASAPGWAVGHSEIAVLDRTVDRTDIDRESWAMGNLRHVAFADPAAAVTVLERLLRSPDTGEDLLFLRSLEPVLEQDFPDFPQYWEPETELDHSVTFTHAQRERLLAILGEMVHPKRLRRFDEQFAFNLQRVADEYVADSSN